MISGCSFVYYGPEQWDSMWRNRHQLLSRLARANRVLYVEPRPYLDDVLAGLRHGRLRPADLASSSTTQGPLGNGSLWTFRWPLCAPVGGPAPLRALTAWVRRSTLNRTLVRLDMQRPIVWLSNPSQADAMRDAPTAALKVYHIVDEYLAYHGLTEAQRAAWRVQEQALIEWADLVVVVSGELLESKGRGNPKFRLLPNGVDIEAFARAGGTPGGAQPGAGTAEAEERATPEGVQRPVLGYVGLISVRLDLELLDMLAARHPEWSLVLIGTVYRAGCGAELDRLAARPNVHLLPRVPAQQIPGIVRRFDLGLAPYKVTPETYHASPLKIYEYLAAGLPVVSAGVPGARLFAEVLAIAETADEWEAAITSQLGATDPQAVAARRRAVAPHTWDARVESLSGMLEEALQRRANREEAS